MATYKTPGVYVEEISTFPPSVAEVSTAIPAFIGYTAKGPKVARINTLLEYETLFGKANPGRFSVSTRTNEATGLTEIGEIRRVTAPGEPDFLLYYSLSLYFKNGGGSCYVFSIGNYTATPEIAHFTEGLQALEMEDEPTLIVFPDAVNLSPADYYSLCQDSLAQCNKLGDRFAILDVLHGEGKIQEFRSSIGINHLPYGAAYHPHLQTSLTYQYEENQVTVARADATSSALTTWRGAFGDKGIVVTYTGAPEDTPKVRVIAGSNSQDLQFSASTSKVLTISNVDGRTGAAVVSGWTAWKNAPNDTAGFEITPDGDGSGDVPHTSNQNIDLEKQGSAASGSVTFAALKSSETSLYNQIKAAMGNQRVVLPPSPAIAGVYAQVDRDRGVWKAPANVSLAAVIGPVSKITDEAQQDLNVDPTAGKSINAIRSFTGKGTLVWGARTLAGNDNEWRYISVRRLFNMIEESARKSTGFAVFEPNDASTWLKVKAMIDSYLYGLWEQGALAGPTPEAAYFVNVGLGKTMTAQDILEGRMIVEIGIAAVRPAEFIILRFSHKMQEA